MSAAAYVVEGWRWRVGQPKTVLGLDARGQCYVHGKDRTIACTLSGTPEAQLEIAHLLAAAPRLAVALRRLVDAAEASGQPLGEWAAEPFEEARAALLEAEGKARRLGREVRS